MHDAAIVATARPPIAGIDPLSVGDIGLCELNEAKKRGAKHVVVTMGVGGGMGAAGPFKVL